MMLNVAEQKQSWFMGKKSTYSIGLLFSVLIFLELLVVVGGWKYENLFKFNINMDKKISNTHEIGSVMYTDYVLYFQISR